MKLPIITEIKSLDHLRTVLTNGQKATIIKLGAKWCQPCKRIEPLVYKWMDVLPDTIQMCLIDVDISFEFYSFLKSKRLVNGIPALLCYVAKDELSIIPDDVVIGSDMNEVHKFFERCVARCNK